MSKIKNAKKLLSVLFAILLVTQIFSILNFNAVFAADHAWYLSGLGDDYTMYYSDHPASVWDQSWVASRMETYEVKSVRLGFLFDDCPGAGTPGYGSIYNQTKMDEVLDIMDGYNVKSILLLQNNGVSCANYAGSWDWYYNWLNVTTDFLDDDRIAAFSIFGEPAKDDYYNTWATDGPVGAITTRLKLQEAFAYLINAIHAIDPDRVVIYPLGSFQYTTVASWVTDITAVGMLNNPNVIFDIVHPYYFENAWDMGLTPTQKVAWYRDTWVIPGVAAFGASRSYCGETFAWGSLTYSYQVQFLTEMINVFVEYEMGFTVWAYFSSPNQSWQNDAILASNYLSAEEPLPPEEPIEGTANITRIQGPKKGTTTTTTISMSLDEVPEAGNLLVAVIGATSENYVLVDSISQTGVSWSPQVYEWYASSLSAIWVGTVSDGANENVTITFTTAPNAGVADICEYSGLLPIWYLDRTASSEGSSVNPTTGVTLTTSQNAELWIGAITSHGNSNQSSPANGFTQLDGITYAGSWWATVGYLEKIVSTTGTAYTTVTIADEQQYAGCIVTLKASYDTYPTYSNLAHNSTLAGAPTLFSVTVDDVDLSPNGRHQFGTNNTGAWVWENLANFTSTPQSLSITKTLNSSLAVRIEYMWNFTDNAGNFATTGLQYFYTTEDNAPTYSSVSHSTAYSTASCSFAITVNDDLALHPGGAYQFATNNTGIWVWDSQVYFTSTPQTISVSKTLNSTTGLVVGYRWNITDNSGNSNSTDIYTLTILSAPSTPSSPGSSGAPGGFGDLSTVQEPEMQQTVNMNVAIIFVVAAGVAVLWYVRFNKNPTRKRKRGTKKHF